MDAKAIALVAVLLAIPVAGALDASPTWQTECHNSTHLLKTLRIVNATSGRMMIDANTTVMCNFGCDAGRDVCYKWPGYAMDYWSFIVIEIFLFGIFVVVIYRLDIGENEMKPFDVIMPAFMTVFFFVMALQSNNVIEFSSGEALQMLFFVWTDYAFAAAGLILFFYSLIKFMGAVATEGIK